VKKDEIFCVEILVVDNKFSIYDEKKKEIIENKELIEPFLEWRLFIKC